MILFTIHYKLLDSNTDHQYEVVALGSDPAMHQFHKAMVKIYGMRVNRLKTMWIDSRSA